MLNILKRSLFLVLLVFLTSILAFCKKINYYTIKNPHDKYIKITNEEGEEITQDKYVANKYELIKFSLNLNAYTKADTKIVKKVILNGTTYNFSPLDKVFSAKLNVKLENTFEIIKEDRKIIKLTYEKDYFNIFVDKEVLTDEYQLKELEKITVKPTAKFNANMQILVNGKLQSKTDEFDILLKNDIDIKHNSLTPEVNDEDIVANQLEQLKLIYRKDKNGAAFENFALPTLGDESCTLTWKIEGSNDVEIKTIDGLPHLVIKESLKELANIKLTATVSKNQVIQTKIFVLKVNKEVVQQEITKEEIIEILKQSNYFLKFIGQDNLASIDNNFSYNNLLAAKGFNVKYEFNNQYLSFNEAKKQFELATEIPENQKVTMKIIVSKGDLVVAEEFLITINKKEKLLPVIEQALTIDKPVDLNDYNGRINNKTVKRLEFLSDISDELITKTKDNQKFIFNNTGIYNIKYRVIFKENITSIEVIIRYTVSVPKNHKLINNYLENLRDNLNKFREYSKINNPEEKVKTPKTVGTDNDYLPDIQYEYLGKKLNDTKTRFINDKKKGYIDYDKTNFEVRVINMSTDAEVGDEVYSITNSKLRFKEVSNPTQIYKIIYKANAILGDTHTFEEYVMIKKGHNAYEDDELRTYFREAFTYENIFLQRSIEIKEHKEAIKQYVSTDGKTTFPYRDYNQTHGTWPVRYYNNDGVLEEKTVPLFDKDGNINYEQRFYQGSIYYRYFSSTGENRHNYLPVKFNGNYYPINVSKLNYMYYTESYMPVPDIQAGVFDISSPEYYVHNGKNDRDLINEVKNVYILGNGGISGDTLEYDNGRKIPKLSGSIHALRAVKSRVNYANIYARNNNGFIYSSNSEINMDYVDSSNCFAYQIYFRNRMGRTEEFHPVIDNTPMTRLRLSNSYLGECGSIGITTADGERKLRHKASDGSYYKTNSDGIRDFNYELHNELASKHYKYEDYDPNDPLDRYRYSCDPTVEVKNTLLETYVSTKSSLISLFNLEDKIKQVTDYEANIKKMGLDIIKHEDDGTLKLNATFIAINNLLTAKPIEKFLNDKNEVNSDFNFHHDQNRVEFIHDDKVDYPIPNMYKKLPKENLDKLKNNYVLFTGFGEKVYEVPELTGTITDPIIANGAHLLNVLNKQEHDLNKLIKLIPIAEFPIYGSENGTLNAYLFFGYKKI